MSELSRIKPLEEVQRPRSYLFYGTFGSGKTNLAIKHPGRKIVIDVDQKLKEDPNIDRSQIDIWEPGELLSDPAGIIIPYSPDPTKVQLGTFPSKEPQGYRRIVAITNELITLSFKNELPYDVAICDSLTRVADHWIRLLIYTHKVTSTELYCPYCGKQTVVGDDSDDYYHGRSTHCTSCHYDMCCL